MEIEDDVELAHVPVVFIHLLDVAVDDLEVDQFIVGGGAARDKEEGGITAIDDFRVCDSILSAGCLLRR